MKNIAILFIEIYQKYISLLLRQLLGVKEMCRFSPTCSEYAKIQIREHGILKGGRMSIVRLLKCQPFYKPSAI